MFGHPHDRGIKLQLASGVGLAVMCLIVSGAMDYTTGLCSS
jgi:hypothetical protein